MHGLGWRRVVTVTFVGLLSLPLFTGHDDLPLSRYPMYASPRASEFSFVVLRGLTEAGTPVELSIGEIADTRDPLVAEAWLRDAVSRDRAEGLCRAVAERVEAERVVAVEVRRETHDLQARARGEPSLRSTTTEARCRR